MAEDTQHLRTLRAGARLRRPKLPLLPIPDREARRQNSEYTSVRYGKTERIAFNVHVVVITNRAKS